VSFLQAGNQSSTVFTIDGLLMVVQNVSPYGSSLRWTHIDPFGLSEAGDTKSVFDPMGNYIQWQHAPTYPPPGAIPPIAASFGGLGPSFGYAINSSCILDGIPTDCSLALNMLAHGSADLCPNNYCGAGRARNGDLVPLTRDPDTGLLGYYALQPKSKADQPGAGARGKAPQNPAQVARPIGGLDKLQAEFEKALEYSDCREALSKVLAQIGSDTSFAPSTTDILQLFSALKNQTGGGGIFVDVPEARVNEFLPERARGGAVFGGSGVSNFYYNDPSNWRTRQRWSVVFLKTEYANTSQLNHDRLPYEYVVTLIHEITHDAPNDSSQFGKMYEHDEMNRAAFKLDGSTSFDQYVKKHCIPKEYW
jgi:hypothetical protein